MLQAGKCIVEKNDPLLKVEIAYLFHAVRNPKPEMEARIRQLRQVKQLDVQQYNKLKRQLPYVVCGLFKPAIRRLEHFARIRYFMLDIDHIEEKGKSIEELKRKFSDDTRVVMCFVSPGEDGLKLLFRLDADCFDAAQYSLFYQLFAEAFTKQYELQQIIDKRTCDVTRACFISHDEEAWYRPEAEGVSIEDYIDFNNPLLVSETQALLNERNKAVTLPPEELKPKAVISEDVFAAIKQKLNPKLKNKIEKPVFVPEQVEQLMDKLLVKLDAFEISLSAVRNIHYGKKLCLAYKGKSAEINLFYGKRGFSVVESPKRGTDAEFNKLAVEVVSEAIHERKGDGDG